MNPLHYILISIVRISVACVCGCVFAYIWWNGRRWGRDCYLMHILSLSVDDGIISISFTLLSGRGCCHVISHLNCCCHCNKIRRSRSISTHLLSLSCIRRKTNTRKQTTQKLCIKIAIFIFKQLLSPQFAFSFWP